VILADEWINAVFISFLNDFKKKQKSFTFSSISR
jgi:hypothetical protein